MQIPVVDGEAVGAGFLATVGTEVRYSKRVRQSLFLLLGLELTCNNVDFDRIGKNLSQSAPLFYNLRSLGCYRAQLDHFTLHELVRYDPGVRYVEHSSVVHHVGSVGNGTTLPPAEHPYSSKKSIFARSSWVPRATVIQASKMWRYYFGKNICVAQISLLNNVNQ